MERRFGADFGTVRIHEASSAPLRASAYTVGADIFFTPGQYAPGSYPGRRLLAHELAHVVQQRHAGVGPPVAGARSSRAEAEASAAAGTALTGGRVPALSAQAAPVVQFAPEETVGWSAGSVLDSVASGIVGPVQWGFIRAFLGGVFDGASAQPAERYQRILARFERLQSLTGGWSEKFQYLKGLGLGILEGIWDSIKGLWDAVVFIVKLPFTVTHFLTTTLPDLAIRFAGRLAEHSDLLEGLREKASKALAELLADPLAAARKLAGFLGGLEKAAHDKARELGRSAVEAVMSFLEEPWFEFGRDVGKIIGMVLFEVALALASDLIGNLVKQVGTWAARLSARAIAATAELFRTLSRLVGRAAEWLRNVARRIGGALGELWEKIAEVLRRFLGTLEDLAGAPELEAAGGPGMRLPASAIDEAKALTTFESRAVKGGGRAGRTTTTKVSELKPAGEAPRPSRKPAASTREAASAERRAGQPTIASGRKARFGRAVSMDYRETYFAAFPEARGEVWVHHAVEQRVLTRYPGVVTEAEMHSLENLRGIPSTVNREVHLIAIRTEWNRFYELHPTTATKQQLLDYATKIDNMFGHLFLPPIR
jgi:hypothetical protein